MTGKEKPLKLHPFQNFEVKRIRRSEIQTASYNPRFLDTSGRVALRNVLEKYGLAETLVWNERTGILVGGHQRLSLMDERAKYNPTTHAGDYLLDVSAVNLDETAERELNLALNNPDIQGQYDLDLFEKLVADGNTNPFNAGFSEAAVEDYLGPDLLQKAVTLYKPTEALTPEATTTTDNATSTPQPLTAAAATDVDLIKQRRREWVANNRDNNDPDHIIILVAADPYQRDTFLNALHFDPSAGRAFLPLDTFIHNLRNQAAAMLAHHALTEAGLDAHAYLTAHQLDTDSPQHAKNLTDLLTSTLTNRLTEDDRTTYAPPAPEDTEGTTTEDADTTTADTPTTEDA